MEQIRKISENTLIPLSLVLLALSAVANFYSESKLHGAAITEIKENQHDYSLKLDNIIAKLNRIEGFLKLRDNKE